MRRLRIPKSKPAATMTRDGLDFVSTTTRLTHEKDNRREFIHDLSAHIKSR